MEAIALLALLDRPIAVHPVFIKLAGSHTAGVMLSQAWYWTRVMQKKRGDRFDGWFYKSQEEWEEETLLKRREWENARKLLRATGFWQENRRDSPARLYYRIDLEAFALALAGEGDVRTRTDDPCDLESAEEGTDRANKIAPSVHTPRAPLSDQTETTSEITAIKQGKPRRPNGLQPEPKMPCPLDILTLYPEIREFMEGFADIESHVKKWWHYQRSLPTHKLRTATEWADSFQYWMADKTPNGNGAANGQSTFESSSERNVRYIRESLAEEDNYQGSPLQITSRLKP